MPSYVLLKSVLRKLYASSSGFEKLHVGKQVVYFLTKGAETLTQVHYLENMLYKFGLKFDVCSNKFYIQKTSCRCGATSYPWRANVLYELTQAFLSATARYSEGWVHLAFGRMFLYIKVYFCAQKCTRGILPRFYSLRRCSLPVEIHAYTADRRRPPWISVSLYWCTSFVQSTSGPWSPRILLQ